MNRHFHGWYDMWRFACKPGNFLRAMRKTCKVSGKRWEPQATCAPDQTVDMIVQICVQQRSDIGESLRQLLAQNKQLILPQQIIQYGHPAVIDIQHVRVLAARSHC